MAKTYKILLRQGRNPSTDSQTIGIYTFRSTKNVKSEIYADGRDTWLDEANPTTNYGNGTLMAFGDTAGDEGNMLLRWIDLHRFIPPAVWIHPGSGLSGNLSSIYLYQTASQSNRNDCSALLQRVQRGWWESQATWNRWKSGNNWSTAGSESSAGDYWPTPIEYAYTNQANNSYKQMGNAINGMGTIFTDWIDNGNETYGNNLDLLWLNTGAAGTGAQFATTEHATITKRPIFFTHFQIRNGRKLGMWNGQGASMGSSRGTSHS